MSRDIREDDGEMSEMDNRWRDQQEALERSKGEFFDTTIQDTLQRLMLEKAVVEAERGGRRSAIQGEDE